LVIWGIVLILEAIDRDIFPEVIETIRSNFPQAEVSYQNGSPRKEREKEQQSW
jgi:hypothetical protein